VPVRWNELADLSSGAHWTVSSVQARLRVGNSVWKDYAASARSLGPAMKAIGFR